MVWWKLHQDDFPSLSKLALKYLCIPATSVPSERIFSLAGLVVNRLRARLSPEHVDMLIFLRKNFHHCDSYENEESESESSGGEELD